MDNYPPFTLDATPGAFFPEAASAAIQIAQLPCLPFIDLMFNGKTIRVTKEDTLSSLQAKLFAN
jgi:hypothetical protein